jgi:hypothetical protein
MKETSAKSLPQGPKQTVTGANGVKPLETTAPGPPQKGQAELELMGDRGSFLERSSVKQDDVKTASKGEAKCERLDLVLHLLGRGWGVHYKRTL